MRSVDASDESRQPEPPRRSPRKHAGSRSQSQIASAVDSVPSSPTKRRRARTPEPDEDQAEALVKKMNELTAESPTKKPKLSKNYVPPEGKFAHLKPLTDRLADNLEVVFCGINPSVESSQKGLHFSGPGNQFWKCLHGGRFTPKELHFSEGPNLSRDYSIGLTDLTSRPTAKGVQLSNAEQREAVPGFLLKIAKHRPRAVCFLSLGVAELVCSFKDVHCRWAKPQVRKGATKPGNILGYLLPFKLRYPKVDSKHKGDVFDADYRYDETLFFALPSPSALNAGYKVELKIAIFKGVHKQLQLILQGSPNAPNTDGFKVVDVTALKAKE